MSAQARQRRRRGLGLWMATALVVGNMIGSGVFLLPSSLASYGGVSIVAWLLTTAGAVLLALVFARLGRAYPQTGGPYAYSRKAFGDFVGFQTAWGYWIAIWAGNAAIAVAFVSYLSTFWGALATNALLAAAVAVAAIWTLTVVNAFGVRYGGWVQGVTTVLKLVPLLAIATVGLLFFDGGNFGAFNASGGSVFGSVTAAAALTLWAFIGLESATVPAEDVADPKRTIPRSTIIGTLVTALVYILGTVAVMGVIPASVLAGSNAPFADAAAEMFGGWAGDAVAIGAIVAAFGALNGWILLQGQIPMAAARDRLFPAVFGRTGRSGAPGVRPGRVQRAGDRAAGHELHQEPGGAVHLHHPAGHPDHPGAVCVLGRRPAHVAGHRPGAVLRAAAGRRRAGRAAGLRLLAVGDRRGRL